MKKRVIASLVALTFILSNFPLHAHIKKGSKDEWKDVEFPQTLKDLRRFEIITLGALPFVIFDANIAYAGYKYIKNDFDKQYIPSLNNKHSSEEQVGILLASVGICIGIGLIDYFINLFKRNSKKERNENINVYPLLEEQEYLPEEKLQFSEEEEVSSGDINEDLKIVDNNVEILEEEQEVSFEITNDNEDIDEVSVVQ